MTISLHAFDRPLTNVPLIGMIGFLWLGLGIFGCQGRSDGRPNDDAGPVRARSLSEGIALAQPGDTIVLPEGTYAGGITLPAGVSLRGAGIGRTVLDASRAEFGVTVPSGREAEVADLTIRGAATANLMVKDAALFIVRRVRTTAGQSGILFEDVSNGRIENVISDGNREGIVINGGHDDIVVNCTVARNAQLGLSFALGDRMAAFNNCLVEDSTAVVLGATVRDVRLDYNLYASPVVGAITGQGDRKTLGDWQRLSAQDAHSLQQAMTFRNPEAGDFRPSEGAVVRDAIVDRGTLEWAGFKAPDHDADHAPRLAPADLGAYEVTQTPPAPR